jgi:hypothetical protein
MTPHTDLHGWRFLSSSLTQTFSILCSLCGLLFNPNGTFWYENEKCSMFASSASATSSKQVGTTVPLFFRASDPSSVQVRLLCSLCGLFNSREFTVRAATSGYERLRAALDSTVIRRAHSTHGFTRLAILGRLGSPKIFSAFVPLVSFCSIRPHCIRPRKICSPKPIQKIQMKRGPMHENTQHTVAHSSRTPRVISRCVVVRLGFTEQFARLAPPFLASRPQLLAGM